MSMVGTRRAHTFQKPVAKARLALTVFAWLSAGCGGKGGALPVPERPGCNPIVGNDCLSGYPTSFYLQDAPDAATGFRLDLPPEVMPQDTAGGPVDPADLNRRDGFSPVAPVLVLLDRPVDPAVLVPETDPARSLEPATASTLLYNASSGELVAHFAEVDLNAPEDDPRQALILRPLSPVGEDQRMVTVLTRRLTAADGGSYLPTPAMQRLLDGRRTGFERIDRHLDAWLDDIRAIEDLGVAPGDLLAVWPYHTASSDWTRGLALALRDDFLEQIGPDGLGIAVDRIEIGPEWVARFPNLPAPDDDPRVEIGEMHGDVALRLRGTFDIPLYLDNDGESGVLAWTGEGTGVERTGTTRRPFVMLVPPTVIENGGRARLLLYGHGLLRGACIEGCVRPGDAELMPRLTHALSVVTVGTDWWGLSQADLGTALAVASDFSRIPRLTDKLVMAALAPIALTRAVQGELLQDPVFHTGSDPAGAVPLADPARPPVYYGNSLGGIMGTTLAALHPDLERMVMNVPGAVWSTMLDRSIDFSPFRMFMGQSYPDAYHQALLLGMVQSFWDLTEPAGFARHVIEEPLPGANPLRRALWTVSMGDCQVPNLASATLLRAAGVPLVNPAHEAWYGARAADNPLDAGDAAAGAFVQWDTLRGRLPPGNRVPEEDNGAHLATRFMPEFQQMVWRFLLGDGAVENRYCLAGRDTDGALPCDLPQDLPANEEELPPLPAIPPPLPGN